MVEVRAATSPNAGSAAPEGQPSLESGSTAMIHAVPKSMSSSDRRSRKNNRTSGMKMKSGMTLMPRVTSRQTTIAKKR